VGVTDAGRRNPAVTAQAAATLHLLTRGRALLGIGVGEREGLRRARDPVAIIPAVNRTIVTGRSRDDVDEALDSVIVKASALAAPAEAWARGTSRGVV
jgi:alkanesulfonate monooxygenase SsuD/methylene tetrahydromethanopterin reductase-like flavin-dependent oxidoreductase (luciferase family)